MLEPQARTALSDLLHPPAGFALSHGVGTTFTLGLDTALTIPLSFAAKRMTADDDPLGILDAVRKSADRLDVFAQAGQIDIELPPSDLVAFLEPLVHPVAVTHGIFHPKVWFLEFERDSERVYRFMCASRNLTADRSWDVVINLEGTVAEASRQSAATAVNAPLVALLRWLPQHTVAPLEAERAARISALADRWSHIEWTAPADMHDIAFHVWGVGEQPKPTLVGKRALLISPFLTDDGIRALKKDVYPDVYLISRGTSIDALDAKTFDAKVRKTFVLDDAADLTREGDEGERRRSGLRGLHAKTYVYDRRDGAHVLVGSLNATGAALHNNVEVMVEAVGAISKFGVEKTLEGFGDLLEEFEYTGGAEESSDEMADRNLGNVLAKVAGVPLHARIDGDGPYSLSFWCETEAAPPADVELYWHPISRSGISIPGLPGTAGDPTVIEGLGLTDITPFVIVIARDVRGDRSAQRTVVLAQLHNDPVDRRDAVIAAHLSDRNAFLRFLMLLLELGGTFASGGGGGAWDLKSAGASSGSGLFEALLRAVGPGTTALVDVERVVAYLSRQPAGAEVLPPGFQDLWAAVWEAQQRIGGFSRG